jgi:hypothetical protein
MNVYELINPSDKCTYEAPDDEVAALTAIILGEGHYAAEECETGRSACGIAFNGLPSNTAGLTIENLKERLEARKADIATALESLIYASASDRKAVKAAGGDIAKFNDSKRSSMNNIGRRAQIMAETLREQLSNA